MGVSLGRSDVELEVDHVAVLHDVFLAFNAEVTVFAGLAHGAPLDQIVVAHNLGLDEAALEVGVDGASGLGGGVAGVNGPGATFLFVEGEKGAQAQQAVGGVDEGVHAGFGHAEFAQILAGFGGGEVDEIAFELGAEEDGFAGVMGAGVFTHGGDEGQGV